MQPWALGYSRDSCKLKRVFASGDAQLALQITQYAPGDLMPVTIVTPDGLSGGEIGYRFGDTGDFEEVKPTRLIWKNFRGDLFSAGWSTGLHMDRSADAAAGQDQWTREKRDAALSDIDLMQLKQGLGDIIELETGELLSPIKSLDACLDELTTHWNIDHEASGKLSRRVKPVDPQGFGRRIQDVYPAEALKQNKLGWIALRVDVDAQGNGTECHIQNDHDVSSFRETLCKNVLGEGLYEPALDQSGNPVASYFATIVKYNLHL